MDHSEHKIISCLEFEELLTDYLDKTLDKQTQKAIATHALKCPLCHSLLNEVKEAVEICHEIVAPKPKLTRLEARILSMTMSETAMACSEFEEYLTDYLDGFLPAPVFHRWERHAVLCEKCTDLPGAVVRSIAACYTYKIDELPLPQGLHEKILQSTIGREKAYSLKVSWTEELIEKIRGFSFPISIPQLAPVTMMLIFAFLIFSQTVSGDGTLSGIYQKSYELAGQTYRESTDAVFGTESNNPEKKSNQEPIDGKFVNDEENK